MFFYFYCKINRNQLERVLEAIYGLRLDKYFEISNIAFRGKKLVTRHFLLHSNSQSMDKIRDLPISIDLRT